MIHVCLVLAWVLGAVSGAQPNVALTPNVPTVLNLDVALGAHPLKLSVDTTGLGNVLWVQFAFHTLFLPVTGCASLTNAAPSPTSGDDCQTSSNGAQILVYPSAASHTGFLALNATYAMQATLKVQVVATYGLETQPVPGACATTGPYAVDSTLFLEWKPASLITQLFFYDANAGYAYTTPPICNLSPLLSYTLYQYDLPEGDFKESTLFSALADMVTPSQIRAKATQISEITSTDSKEIPVDSQSRLGVVYAVIVSDSQSATESVYPLAATFACSFLEENTENSCLEEKDTPGDLATVIVALLLGLFLAIFGLRLYVPTVYLSAVLLIGFSVLIAFDATSVYSQLSYAVRTTIEVLCGIVGGALALLLWQKTMEHVGQIWPNLGFGFIVSMVLFATPFGALTVFQNNFNWGVTFASVTIACAFVFLFWRKLSTCLFSSLWGAFGIFLFIDHFVASNFSYMIVDVVKRASDHSFAAGYLGLQFTPRDIAMWVSWAVTALLSFLLQWYFVAKNVKELPCRPFGKDRFATVYDRRARMRHLYHITSQPDDYIHSLPDPADEEYPDSSHPFINSNEQRHPLLQNDD